MGSPIAGYQGSVLITSTPNVALTNEVLTDAGDHKTFNISSGSFATKRYWDRTATFVVQAELDEVQTVAITGSPTGGTFTLTFAAQTTAALNWNATAAQVQTALQALSSINANNALVTGGPGPGTAFAVEFTGTLGFAGQALITLGTNSLTGGSSPSVSITRAQAGITWTTQAASTYTIRYVTGQVLFTNAFLGSSVGCRVSSGAYLPFSTFANMKQWEATPALDLYDSTTFGSPWKTYTPGLLGADVKLTQFYSDLTFVNQITANTAFIVSCLTGRNATERFEGFGRLKSDDIKVMVNGLEEENLNYTIDGQWYYFAGQYV
jgi:hypothetical protein